MNQNHQICDVWQGTLALLGQSSALSSCFFYRSGAHVVRHRNHAMPSAPKVTASCRLSGVTVSVSWHDPTSCRYDDQIWRLGVAWNEGCCSLSGAPIYRGDKVYRPIPVRPAPSNRSAMILAVAVENLPADAGIAKADLI